MEWKVGGALLWIFILVQLVSCEPPRRLIAFNESHTVWMTEMEAEELAVWHNNFMDITEHQNPVVKTFRVDPIPSKLAYESLVLSLGLQVEEVNFGDTIAKLSSFFTRFSKTTTGKEAAEWIYNQFIELSAARQDIKVEYFKHSWEQPSVIARIEGAGQGDTYATRIVIGAHEDSIGLTSRGQAPGADDDASGIATLLEAFRVLAQSGYKPERTVEFHAYSAEESGLLGSQDIAETYSELDIVVESMMQLDMTMYAPTESQPIGVVTDYTNGQLTKFLGTLLGAYTTVKFEQTQCGYGCSDHASWNRYGYRACFPFETPFSKHNPYIHTPSDTLSELRTSRGVQFARLAIGYVIEMAGVASE